MSKLQAFSHRGENEVSNVAECQRGHKSPGLSCGSTFMAGTSLAG